MIKVSRAFPRLAPLVVLAAALSACASPAPVPEPAISSAPSHEPARRTELRLAPGDSVEIAVLTAPELTRVVEIAPDGSVRPPLAGRVEIAGLTPDAAADAIAEAYAGTLREPRIEVRPARFAPRD
ncbi:polysaccharide biosynthesis/export family protein [Marinicauda salina]|nr:polysaccharide biosynthesis/export family protein [Marinicauda salina]